MNAIRQILTNHPLIPVVTLHRLEWALPLVEALERAQIHILELTLRTDTAWDAITLIKEKFPHFCVGVATALEAAQFKRLQDSPVDYIGSPAVTEAVLQKALHCRLPYLPSAGTLVEILWLYEQGFDTLKFYPAHIMGGANALQHFEAVFPSLRFCVSGGVSAETALEYLQLSNVDWVAGSWLVRQKDLQEHDWHNITQKAGKLRSSLHNLPKWESI
ncbi:MAG: bifunctional 4-hydroxy-2-oxoglutarate aldolase/2-dehydro-3-deoxy-phosphogluconate aldolase [Gammaproteobacteria bacterium]|nr:bifunctional 4-hydroxy-2-oxoglutarate aldolase/2-dehydro-3-deoxy-phosphogluconate aldolase [Gammaproteobacteria bacterium]